MTVKFQTTHEMIVMAKRNLSHDEWDYINGAAESETSLRRNRLALDCLAFRPRVLRDVTEYRYRHDFAGSQAADSRCAGADGRPAAFHQERRQ